MDDVTLHLPTPDGKIALKPASRADERLVESYQLLLHRWLATGDSRELLALGGQTVADAAGGSHPLLTDPDALRALVFDWSFDRAEAHGRGGQRECQAHKRRQDGFG